MSERRAAETLAERRVPILVAIIAVAGAMLPILVTSISIQVSNTPIVDIHVSPHENSTKPGAEIIKPGAEIILTNIGFAPATNLTLIVYAPGRIEINNTRHSTVEVESALNNTRHSTVEVESALVNLTEHGGGRRIDVSIPELVHGGGSIVKLDLNISEAQNANSNEYNVYVTYDQGSSSNAPAYVLGPNDLYLALKRYFDIFANLLVTPAVFVFYVSLLIALSVYYYYYFKKRARRRFFLLIINNITDIYHKLKKDNKSKEGFQNPWNTPDYNSKLREYLQKKDMRNYIILTDFYTKLDKRNENRNQISEDKLEKLNNHLLQLSNNALLNIDWKKFT